MTVQAASAIAHHHAHKTFSAPASELNTGRYTLRFARTARDLRAVQRLRFEVFNIECGQGLAASYADGLDADRYDQAAHHLLVCDARGHVVGTYRLRPETLTFRTGLYSAEDFETRELPEHIYRQGAELGRACVKYGHRNGRVLRLLWKGLARYVQHMNLRYVFGCCSLPTTDEAAAWRLYDAMRVSNQVADAPSLKPVAARRCARSEVPGPIAEVPPLLRSYLGLGAKVCSEPALDREFGVISFFVVLDTHLMQPRTKQALFDPEGWT